MKYLLILLAIFAVACTQAGTVTQAETNTVQAAPINVQTIDGEQFSLESNINEGKGTVVYFMSSTCPTCAKNWEALNEVYPEYEDRVDFVAVSVDPTDSVAVLSDLAVEKNFVFATSPGNPQLAVDYSVTKQTAKFAIDSNGNIIERHDGALTAAEWRAFFEQVA